MSTTPFVGREAELDRLSGFLDRALAGKCSVCLVTGEAGSGKTALLTEFARRAQDADPDLVVAMGDCNAQTGLGDPFLPFREILGLLTGDVESLRAQGRITGENASRLQRLLRTSAELLVENGPDLVGIFVPAGAILARLGARAVSGHGTWVERLRGLAGREEATKQQLDPTGSEQARDRMFEQYTNVLRALSRRHPLVLVFDDLQWADEASVALLFHLDRRLQTDRILIVGAYRADDVRMGRAGGRHPLEPVVNEMQRTHGAVRIDLSATDASTSRARPFLDALVDAEPNRLDEGFRAALHRHTGGHPLFTLELLRSMREGGELVRDEEGRWTVGAEISWDALPPRVEAVIEERARRLDPELDEALSVASVEGDSFTAEVTASVLGLDTRRVVRMLSGPLVRDHRLVRSHGRERVGGRRLARYGFHHSLVQRFFYGRLDPVERSYLHGDVGEALEELHRGREDEVAHELARHFELAGDERKAVGYLSRAAEKSRRAYAHAEASTLVERALRLLREAPPEALEEGWRRDVERSLYEARGDLAVLTGDHARSLEAYEKALSLVDEDGVGAGDTAGVTAGVTAGDTSGVTASRIHRKTARPRERRMELDLALEALDRADEALRSGRGGADAGHDDRADGSWRKEQIEIGIARAWIHYWRDDPGAVAEVRRTLAPVVSEHGSPDARARFRNLELLMRYRRERYRLSEETLALADEVEAACRESDHPREMANGRFAAGFARLWRGELEAAEPRLLESLESAEKYGDRHLASRALTYLTLCRRRMGRVDETEVTARRALRVSEDAAVMEYVGMARANLSWVELRRGRPERAAELASDALARWEELNYDYPVQWAARLPLAATALPADVPATVGDARPESPGSEVAGIDRQDETDLSRAVRYVRPLLHPPQMQLPETIEGPLQEAVRAFDAGESTEARARFGRALALAREGGFG